MFRALTRFGCTVAMALALLLSGAPSVHATELDLQAPGQTSWVGDWLDEVFDAVRSLFYPGEGEPGSPIESATSNLGGPTGPCIDPQGGWTENSCR